MSITHRNRTLLKHKHIVLQWFDCAMMGIGICFLMFFLFVIRRKGKGSTGNGPIEILNGGSHHHGMSTFRLAFRNIFHRPHHFQPSNPVGADSAYLCYQEDTDSGSFYLKMGSLVFAIGSIIYTCLEMGVFVENNSCFNIVIGIEPCFFVIFVMLQLYFIFRSSQVSVSVMLIVTYNDCVYFVPVHLPINIWLDTTKEKTYVIHVRSLFCCVKPDINITVSISTRGCLQLNVNNYSRPGAP